VPVSVVQEEFNIAKRELQQEVKNGLSIQDLRTGAPHGRLRGSQLPHLQPGPPGQASISRNVWDADDYIRRHRTAGAVAGEAQVVETAPDSGEGVKPLRKAAWAVEESLAGELMYTKTFALESYSLLVSGRPVLCPLGAKCAHGFFCRRWGVCLSREDRIRGGAVGCM